MTDYQYDPDNYLLSSLRVLKAYVLAQFANSEDLDGLVDVEMSFPDTANWTKTNPLERALVHFEVDDDPEMRLGFGVPQTSDEVNGDGDSVTLSEPALHQVSFDVGVWTSAQTGGTTKRVQIRQALYAIFGPAGARRAFTEATGIVVRAYGGGSDVLDRINDVPVYRTTGITLTLSVFSRHTDPEPVGLVTSFDEYEKLSIRSDDGSLRHLTTDEDPWS